MSNPTPGYFDIQINGYMGVDWNQPDVKLEDVHRACEHLEAGGVDMILATVITEKIDVMSTCLRNLVRFRDQDPLVRRMIAGFHIEGPFINEQPGYRGAHPADAIHPADADEMKQLLDAAGGMTRLVTLAPERDPGMKVTTMLAKQGIVVSAGHCDASMDELNAAVDAGLSMYTHLGNGCPMQMHRSDNIIQRALSLAGKIWPCFIADGAHVAWPALKNFIRCAGLDHCCVVTDAVTPAGLGPGTYKISRWELVIGDDLVARAPDGSHLVGAAITMRQTEENLVHKVGLPREDARKLLTVNPRKAMRM